MNDGCANAYGQYNCLLGKDCIKHSSNEEEKGDTKKEEGKPKKEIE